MNIPEGQLISFDPTQFTDEANNTYCQLLYGSQPRYFQVKKEYEEVIAYKVVTESVFIGTTEPATITLDTIANGSRYFSMRSFSITQIGAFDLEINNLKITCDGNELFDLKNNEPIGSGSFTLPVSEDIVLEQDLEVGGFARVDMVFAIYDRNEVLDDEAYYKVSFDSFGESQLSVFGKQYDTITDSVDYIGYATPSDISPSDTLSIQANEGDVRNVRIYKEIDIIVTTSIELSIGGTLVNPTEENETHLLYKVVYDASYGTPDFVVYVGDEYEIRTSNKFKYCYNDNDKYSIPDALNPSCGYISTITVDNKEMCIGDSDLYPFDYTNIVRFKTSILDQFRKENKIEGLETYKGFINNYFTSSRKAVIMSVFKPNLINLEPYMIDFFSILLGRTITIDNVTYQINEPEFLEKDEGKFTYIKLELDLYNKQTICK